MVWIARISVAIVLLFSLTMGALTWFAPDKAAAALGVSEQVGLGLNTFRADIGSLFWVSAIGAAGALFAGKRTWLYLPILLLGMALVGRVLGLGLSGVPEGVMQPIIIEAVLVALCVLGLRHLR